MSGEELKAVFLKMLIDADALETLVRDVEQGVRELLKTPQKELAPGLLVFARESPDDAGKNVLLDLGWWSDDEEKVERYRRAGGSFQGTGQVPVAVVAFQEAWAAPPRDGDQRRPADHPDRYEVIVIGGGALGWREGEGVYQAHRM